ncbi:MAG: DUF3054 domain-containing protein [Acidimicrobiales bacterium]
MQHGLTRARHASLSGVHTRTLTLGLDVLSVLVFVIIGRATHSKGDTVAGIASTAWPFLAGLAAGWLGGRAWKRPTAIAATGIAAWLGCVALGMTFRVIAGQGTAFAFILVALGFLGATMLGWRLAWRALDLTRQPSR